MEFTGLSAEQRAAIRDWAAQSKAEAELSSPKALVVEAARPEGERKESSAPMSPPAPRRKRKRWGRTVLFLLLLVAALGGVGWWRWNRGWEDLESGLRSQGARDPQSPQANVPAQEMEKLVVHRVDPEYPAEARAASLRGVIVLDIVVGRDGSVLNVRPLNGPEVLARSATDALRWWRFQPYRLGGEPAVVETTVAVEFKP
jgi:TonB family protein